MISMATIVSAIKKGDYAISSLCHPSLISCQNYIEASATSPSGLSCIDHAYAIIKILNYLSADADTINAALLYSMVEYGDLPAEDLDDLPDDVFSLVNGVQTMGSLHQVYSASRLGDNLAATDAMRRMMLAMVYDGRTVLIKLVEQVVILLHSKSISPEMKKKLAGETMMIYAPLANRLGLSELKWQLEDLSFRLQSPEIYHTLSDGINLNRSKREAIVSAVVAELEKIMASHNVKVIKCYGRAKHLYSLYKKMQRKNLNMKEIYDSIAIRVILESVDDCYTILSAVHENWQFVMQEFDDYIAKPKSNGYQSIHTAILFEGQPVEIQIRTEGMHENAELGVAAHWLYKEGVNNDLKSKTKWLLQLTKADSGSVDVNAPNTFEQNAIRLFQDRVFVFTPHGEVKDLMNGATALDFAYAIHSQVGHNCKGVKINGMIKPIKTLLKNGDRIEVLTKKNGKPSLDWLKAESGFLRTAKARAKVAQWFRLHDEQTQAQGKARLHRFAKANNLDLVKIQAEVIAKLKLSKDAFYYRVGADELNLASTFRQYMPLTEPKAAQANFKTNKHNNIGISVSGFSGVQTNLASCCFPIPGDEIIGVITSSRGVVVHRQGCANSEKVDNEKIMPVSWLDSDIIYEVHLFCSCTDYLIANNDLQTIIAKEKLRLTHLNLINKHDIYDQTLFEFRVLVKDLDHLERLINSLRHKKTVINVWR